uniref:Cryptide Pep-22 n=1 Tax=Tityus obscurus TaxID=1221240 RepID=CRY22_TITOB
HGCIGCGR